MAIDVTSPAFAEDEMIPERYAKEGDDVFPALEWSGVPDDARELAVLLEDPDAPGGRFTHWEVAGINPSVRRLDTGELPDGAVQGRNDFGDLGLRRSASARKRPAAPVRVQGHRPRRAVRRGARCRRPGVSRRDRAEDHRPRRTGRPLRALTPPRAGAMFAATEMRQHPPKRLRLLART